MTDQISDAGAEARGPSIFVSAATTEFRAVRKEIGRLLRDYGEIHVQEEHPTALDSGIHIQELIDKADLCICVIGYQFGWEFPPNDRLADAYDGCSWTQWEYDHAREVVRHASAKRLVAFVLTETRDCEPDPKQMAFRARIQAAEESSPNGLFLNPFKTDDELVAKIRQMVEDPLGGFAAIQYRFWLNVREAYRRRTVDRWHDTILLSYNARTDASGRSALMRASDPPFVERRSFVILHPKDGHQLEFLQPPAFVTGRDTNLELDARARADWRLVSHDGDPTERSDGNRIVDSLRAPYDHPATLAGIELPSPTRLFLISGSGIGKSVTLAWIEARLNGLATEEGDPPSDSPRLAILLLAGDLVTVTAEHLPEHLAAEMLRCTNHKLEQWHLRAVRVGLRRETARGEVVLIIDGLDHVGTDPAFLVDLQRSGDFPCPIVVAGRPQALQHWRDRPGPGAGMIAAGWRFIEPTEFSEDEADVYLGSSDADPASGGKRVSRLSIIEDRLVGLWHVPRILEYVRTLNAVQLTQARTAADIYYAAVQQIVRTAMLSPKARRFGPDWEQYINDPAPHPEQIRRMTRLLAALGFMSLCRTYDPAEPRGSHDFRMPLDMTRRRLLRERLNGTRASDLSRQELQREMAELERDLEAVAAMSAVIGNGVLEDLSAQGTGLLDSVMWANRTVQQFFAALWLARYAEGADAVEDILNGQELEPSADPAFDLPRARHYVFFPEADMTDLKWDCDGCPNMIRTDVTYEFNLFLAEMPRAAIDSRAWVAAVSPWYDPKLFIGQAAGMRIWSSEMLYRSWPMMARLAGRPMDDWWDTSYDKLATHPVGQNRFRISPYYTAADDDPEPLARLVLDRFGGDFDSVLNAGGARAAVAGELIAPEQWRRVPDATDFEMGTPREAPQGVPTGKADAYWRETLLDTVQTRTCTPLEAAEQGTWPEWFAPGGVGNKGREDDIRWLRERLEPLAREGEARGLTAPDRESPTYEKAFYEIACRFKTNDETPKENPQSVRGFDMHRFPLLHRYFWLFAPGHRRVIDAYLAHLPDLTNVDPTRRLETAPAHPPDDHPVTYTSWYDAWAFCQWVNWKDSESGTRFGLRLPCEPEWEFAARWHTNEGEPTRSPRDWRWWWGNTFYSDEASLDAEIPIDKRAHADGRPGKTRAPADAEPNGLGFHDILGNVWEWTATLYHEQRERDIWNMEAHTLRYSRFDPLERPPVNGQRTMRGGLWYYLSILATCANRFRYV